MFMIENKEMMEEEVNVDNTTQEKEVGVIFPEATDDVLSPVSLLLPDENEKEESILGITESTPDTEEQRKEFDGVNGVISNANENQSAITEKTENGSIVEAVEQKSEEDELEKEQDKYEEDLFQNSNQADESAEGKDTTNPSPDEDMNDENPDSQLLACSRGRYVENASKEITWSGRWGYEKKGVLFGSDYEFHYNLKKEEGSQRGYPQNGYYKGYFVNSDEENTMISEELRLSFKRTEEGYSVIGNGRNGCGVFMMKGFLFEHLSMLVCIRKYVTEYNKYACIRFRPTIREKMVLIADKNSYESQGEASSVSDGYRPILHIKTKQLGVKATTKTCLKLLYQLSKHKYAYPFMAPVDPKKDHCVNYFQVIRVPMDLSTIRRKLQAREITDYRLFGVHMSLVFDNAMKYNHPSSNIFRMAKEMKRLFLMRLSKVSDKDTMKYIREQSKEEKEEIVLSLKENKEGRRNTKKESDRERVHPKIDAETSFKKARTEEDGAESGTVNKEELAKAITSLPDEYMREFIDLLGQKHSSIILLDDVVYINLKRLHSLNYAKYLELVNKANAKQE